MTIVAVFVIFSAIFKYFKDKKYFENLQKDSRKYSKFLCSIVIDFLDESSVRVFKHNFEYLSGNCDFVVTNKPTVNVVHKSKNKSVIELQMINDLF
jgi:hypothetical protein